MSEEVVAAIIGAVAAGIFTLLGVLLDHYLAQRGLSSVSKKTRVIAVTIILLIAVCVGIWVHQILSPYPVQIVVSGKQGNGEPFRVPATGRHNIQIVEGAYSPWPSDDHPDYQGWLFTLYIYRNRPVGWGTTHAGLQGPINPDERIGQEEIYLTKNEAEAASRERNIQMDLEEGDHLVFVPLDVQGTYDDNRGEVTLKISWASQ